MCSGSESLDKVSMSGDRLCIPEKFQVVQPRVTLRGINQINHAAVRPGNNLINCVSKELPSQSRTPKRRVQTFFGRMLRARVSGRDDGQKVLAIDCIKKVGDQHF